MTEEDRMVESRRNADMSAEGQLGIFLDTYLYQPLFQTGRFSSIQRIGDIEEQMAGVDVRFTGKDGAVYCVDEKAQLYYLNRALPTFAFEVQYLGEGGVSCGWLCSGRLKTDLYLLIWPFAVQDSPDKIRWDQFTKADCLLVERRKVLALLGREGLSLERMAWDAAQIRREGCAGRVSIKGVKGIYYYASDPKRYREAPINVIIAKKRLFEIARRQYIVTKEGVEVR